MVRIFCCPVEESSLESRLRYQRKSKAKARKLDISLIDEAVTALSSPMTQCLGTSSQALDGSVVQNLPMPSGGEWGYGAGSFSREFPPPLAAANR
jgi:hypothetical protein